MIPRWYLSAAAIRHYLALAEITDDDGGPQWAAAERAVATICADAHLVRDDPAAQRQSWRSAGKVEVGGRKIRLDLVVSTAPRREGPLPQLIAITNKDARK